MGEQDFYLDAGVRGYIVNTARKNLWKIAWYELDDLVQDGYLCYAKCRQKYRPLKEGPPTKDDRKQFQAFLEVAFRNHIADLALKPRSCKKELVEADFGEDASPLETWAGGSADLGDASLAALLARAPAEIMEILELILVDGCANALYQTTRLREKVLPNSKTPRMIKAKRAVRETTAEHYDRCLGRVGVVAQLKSYLLQTE